MCPMCTIQIEAQLSRNDPNGSMFPINTHPISLQNPLEILSLFSKLGYSNTSYLRILGSSILRGPFVSIPSFFYCFSSPKVKLCLTFCIDQFMVNAKFV
ncbi:hypothetical protein Hanom_Chr12g01103291 [Helianthus anomalus]